ncbi:ArsR family transcriptional regulator [Streptomyces venezuelae]|uniref:ArsR family transcriptional regulator n=1 Tax=Streptomyces venezuelae TaxID=54571 RepID=UPI0037D2DD48
MRAARRVTKIETVNRTTGEMQDLTVHSSIGAAHGLWFRGGGFTTMGYDAHNALAEADLSAASYKLFHKMCALQNRKDHGLVRVETQVKFAEQVGMSQSTVSRSLRQLAEAGFIYPDGRDWRIRPDFVFNGNGAAQGQAIRSIPAGTPDPYAGKGTELTVIDGGNDSDA